MTGHPELDELELLAAGQGTQAAAEHVETCAGCAREVAWLKAEKALFARRAQPDVSALWSGIEERLQRPQLAPVLPLARRRWQRPVAAVAGFAAAAAVALFMLHPKAVVQQQPPAVAKTEQPPPAQAQAGQPKPRSRLDPKTLAALETAETDYRHAASVLEAEYETMRPKLDPKLAARWDETLTRARTQLGESRAVAADDVRARMRVLDGYAEYLRSLRDVIQGSEEATP